MASLFVAFKYPLYPFLLLVPLNDVICVSFKPVTVDGVAPQSSENNRSNHEHLQNVTKESDNEDDVGGINISKAKSEMRKKDRTDRKKERERIRKKHKEIRLKQKRARKGMDDVSLFCLLCWFEQN